jgi:hypothetical protein
VAAGKLKSAIAAERLFAGPHRNKIINEMLN